MDQHYQKIYNLTAVESKYSNSNDAIDITAFDYNLDKLMSNSNKIKKSKQIGYSILDG